MSTIWSDQEIDFLKRESKKYTVYEIKKILNNKTERQIYQKLHKLKLKYKYVCKSKYLNLNEVFIDYRRLLRGDIKKFKKDYLINYDIFLFKYYLNKNNIIPSEDWVYNIHFSKLLKQAKLHSRIKKKWHSCYDFIACCFPKYNLKEYNFKTLQVRQGFWSKDYNCYMNIREGIVNAKKDKVIKNEDEILDMNLSEVYKYFHKSMIYFRKMKILCQYLKSKGFDISATNYYNNIRFDSLEEKKVYKHICNNNIHIIKNKRKFYNAVYDEGYIPDFIVDNNIIVEYFGLYDTTSKSDICKKYCKKTKRKVDFFNNLTDYKFLDLYPEDLYKNKILKKVKVVKNIG